MPEAWDKKRRHPRSTTTPTLSRAALFHRSNLEQPQYLLPSFLLSSPLLVPLNNPSLFTQQTYIKHWKPGTATAVGDMPVGKTHKDLCPPRAHVQWAEQLRNEEAGNEGEARAGIEGEKQQQKKRLETREGGPSGRNAQRIAGGGAVRKGAADAGHRTSPEPAEGLSSEWCPPT